MYNLFNRKAEINKRSTWDSPTIILIAKSLNIVSGVNSKININNDIQLNSNITNTKKLNELATKARPTSPLLNQVKIMNNIKSSKIVCIPKGIENSLTTYAQKANPIAVNSTLFHFRGSLAITKAKVTVALSSGIPCKSKAINGILTDLTTHPTKNALIRQASVKIAFDARSNILIETTKSSFSSSFYYCTP